MTTAFRPDHLLPGTSIGNYIIHRLLGRGSSGTVYEVRSQEGNPFAMKVSRFRPGEPSSQATLMDRRFSRSIVCLEERTGKPVAPFLFLPANDLYALGLIFYEVLTGRHPFVAPEQTEEELLEKIASQEPPHPRELNPQIPFLLDDAVMWLLRKDPKLRCQNGDDVVKTLEQGMAKVANASWDVRLQVGKPVPLVRLVAAVAEVPAPPPPAIVDDSEVAQVARRWRPAAWLAAGAAALVVAMGLVVGGQRWASQSPAEGLAGVPVFDTTLPAWVDHDADVSGVPLVGQVPGEAYTGPADAATQVSELVPRATLITGALPGQKLAPCDKRKSELKYKGACWHLLYHEAPCDSADLYEPEVGYCEKWHAIYRPVYAEKKAKQPPAVVEPGASDAPVIEDR